MLVGIYAPVEEISIVEQTDIVRARAEARRVAGLIGFGLADQTRLATAISELTRNVLQYAGRGHCEISDISDEQNSAIKVVITDYGPGIPDIGRAMQDGYSTSGGLGAGLPGTQRLVDGFEIESRPGHARDGDDAQAAHLRRWTSILHRICTCA